MIQALPHPTAYCAHHPSRDKEEVVDNMVVDLVRLSCTSKGTTARASSTWKHDTRKFGPLNALNNNTEDAWKSAQSEESDPLAFFEIDFHRPVHVNELRIQFQGGFVGMDCIVYQKSGDETTDWEECEDLFIDPIDSNEVQTFESEADDASGKCSALRIEFGRSTDFYGRIVIYSLEVWGTES